MVDYAFLSFIVLVTAILAAILFRKRLMSALSVYFLENGAVALNTMLFQQVVVDVEGKKVTQNVLTPWATGLLSQAAPILVSEGMKAIKLKIPQNLPINAEGQLDFMAPVLQKLAAGKKLKFDDFLPVIMEKAMPYVEGFLGNMAQGGVKQPGAPDAKNPFLRELGQ